MDGPFGDDKSKMRQNVPSFLLSMLTGVQMLVDRGLKLAVKLSLVRTPDVGVFTTTGAT